MFKIGDIVSIRNIDDGDNLHGRYIGETGIFQGYDGNLALVRFINFDKYYTFPSDIELVKNACVESILSAFNIENQQLLDRLVEYVKGNR